jgi:hypothetical protein
LIGAEYQSRSLTTTLTFAPSRLNLFLAKAVAACAFGAVFALAAMTVTAAAMLPALALHGAPSAGEPHLATFAGLALRGAGLCTITAAIGFGIATIGRSTAAALGGGFAYIIIIENIIGSVWVKTRRWLFLGNAIVFVSGKNSGGEVPGRTVASAAMVITGVAGAWLIGATAAFANRDVS